MIIRLGTRQVPALALLAVLCVLVCGLGFWQAVGDSTTIGEPAYVTARLTALQRPQQVLGGTEVIYHLR
jgi:class 3 adenylate cyclase